jgi:hypothetical protein
MLHFISQLSPAGFPQQPPAIPELPPGPSLDRVRGPVEIPFMETWQIALIALLGIIIVILIGWKQFKKIRAKRNNPTPLSPQDAVIAELQSAAARAVDDDEQFAVRSSLAVRRYFETGKSINALDRTTDEFLNDLSDHSLLDDDTRKLLADFLHHCDQVKFAQVALTQEERQELTSHALELIQKCEATQPATNQNPES